MSECITWIGSSSVTSAEMADGSPPADVYILTAPDTLQTEVSVMTVMSERWMERFVMNPHVWMA